jgi:uncharacterized membrane protein YcaP (DUF421 family)
VELHRIAVRVVFAYLVLLALLRASGKRTIAHGSPFDFVLALVLGDMIDDLLWAEVSAAKFTIAAGTLTLAHTLVSVAGAWSERFSTWVSGSPAAVFEHGRPRGRVLRAERIGRPELERLLRLEGVAPDEWNDVRCANVEVSGHPSVLREPWAREARASDVAAGRPSRK